MTDARPDRGGDSSVNARVSVEGVDQQEPQDIVLEVVVGIRED